MLKNKEAGEIARKLVGAALCDFVSYLTSMKDPFIVGGQYPKDKLVNVFHEWLFNKQFAIKGAHESTNTWNTLCRDGVFCPDGPVSAPPAKTAPPPPMPLPPMPHTPEPLDDLPEDGHFNGDEWKPESERKERWQDEGEDWKDGDQNNRPEGFDDNDFQPT